MTQSGDRILVATGTYTEKLLTITGLNGVSITGGWNAAFTTQASAFSTGATVLKPAVATPGGFITATSSTNFILDSVRLEGVSGVAVGFDNYGSSVTISNCDILGFSYGIAIASATLTLNKCAIHHCGETGLQLGLGQPIAGSITNNRIYANGRYGIMGQGIPSSPMLIANNIVYDNVNPMYYSVGITLGGQGQPVHVINNTVSGSTYGIALNAPGGSTIANNIIVNSQYGIESSAPNTLISKNVLFNVQVPYTAATSTTDLYVNPLLKADWHLESTSPCINAGTAYGTLITTDVDGDPRTTAVGGDGMFDIGADEYFYVNPAPTVLTHYPVNGASNVARSVIPTVTFSEAVLAGTNYSQVSLKDNNGVLIPCTIGIVGTVLSIDPVPTLLTGRMKHFVTIPAGAVNDLEGKPLAAPYQFSFTTAR